MADWLAEGAPEKDDNEVDLTLNVGMGAQVDLAVVLALDFGERRLVAKAGAVPRLKLGPAAAAACGAGMSAEDDATLAGMPKPVPRLAVRFEGGAPPLMLPCCAWNMR